MNRLIIILIFLFGTQIDSKAQSNQVEAKAAYLLAEESFANGDYESTLKYLGNATQKLGKANSKLLYLKIQAELELYKTDRSYFDQVIKSISAFQNSPDVKSFTEEKVLEIAKLKMQITNEYNKQLEQEKRAKDEKERYANTFRDFTFENWPIGGSFTELKLSHQDSAIFKRKVKSRNIFNNVNGKYIKSDIVENIRGDYANYYGLENTIISVITQGDIVKGYKKIIYNQYKLGGLAVSSNTDKTYFDARKEIEGLVKKLSREFGFEPVISKNIYRWEKDDKIVELHDKSFSNNNRYSRWKCEAVLEISEL